MRRVLTILLGAWLMLNCNLISQATLTPTPVVTTAVESPVVRLQLSEASSTKNSAEILVGGAAQVTIISDPIFYSITQAEDGSIESSSMKPWGEHNLSEMRVCVSLDKPCELSPGDWKPFAGQEYIEVEVDWIGPRDLFVTAEYRDAQGNTVLSISEAYQEPQSVSQADYTIIGFWDEATPLESLPAPVQTAVAATRSAYPVSGSVEWEGGRCCAGGVAGETIQVQADFSANSPFGEVIEMRVATGGICFDEQKLSGVAWEPFTPNRSYPIRVALNWVGHYVSVQYRDDQGNLSPVYCDDISVEGSPPPPANP